ncbi:hypothetical protein [Halonatronum saccharophilum]|uniref:hypothetical protein n=1 Tax=Halonatronum saccharophilum TaxID=150060 RepID=UPI0004B1DA89|nr:hypothetical protein [Halonatronum saccharophilum]
MTATTLANLTNKNEITTKDNIEDKIIEIEVVAGEEWEHKLRIIRWLPFIRVTNQPQIAIWIEDINKHYLETLYVTESAAKQNWRRVPSEVIRRKEINRPEALPHWTHQRKRYEDEEYLATKAYTIPDVVTSATPKESFRISSKVKTQIEEVIIKVEVNHSTHFNEYYSKDIKEGNKYYSGGEWGSGQPAVIYAGRINFNDDLKEYSLRIIGHSSPDGQSGRLYSDISKLTTAKDILEDIIVKVEE